jgi:hypothetical protein
MSRVPLLTTSDKMNLSAMVASAALDLYSSPWLKPTWTKDDIVFLQRDGLDLYRQAFVARSLPELKSGSADPKNMPSIIRNPVLFALGVLLMEICLGTSIDQLRTDEDYEETGGHLGPLTDLLTARRLIESHMVLKHVGPQCHAAIATCINLSYGPIGEVNLEDDKFRERVFTEVVSVFEEQAAQCRKWSCFKAN